MTAPVPSTGRLPPYRRISGAIPYVAPVAAVAGTLLTVLLGLYSLTVISLYATVPVLVASAGYFVADDSLDITAPTTRELSQAGLELSVALYFAVYGLAILLVAVNDVRPMAFYALVGVLAVLVLAQILWTALSPFRVALTLAETSGLLLGVLWSVTLKYHYFFARTDVFVHHSVVEGLVNSHRVTAAFGSYQPFPLWHVYMGFQTMLFEGRLGPLKLSFVVTGLLFLAAPPAVYALARRFHFTRRVSLVAALGTCLNPFVILYGMYSIPRSVTSLFVPFCLLLLFVEDRRASALYVCFLVGIAAYHTVSLPFVFLTVGCYFAAERLLSLPGQGETGESTPVVAPWAVAAIPVIQFAYWLVAAPDLIARLAGIAAGGSSGGETGGATATPFIEAPYHELVNYLPFGLIVLFVLFGVVQSGKLTTLSRRSKGLLLSALVITTVSVPGPALLVSLVSGITADMAFRIGQYTYPLEMIGFAVGVVAAVKSGPSVGWRRVSTAVVLLLVFSMAFLAVSNDFVASDNPVTERSDFYNFYLDDAETTSFETIATRTETPVTSDYVTCRYLNNPGPGDCAIIQADQERGRLFSAPDSVVVVRTGELRDRPLSIYPTSEPVADPPYSNNRDSLSRQSAVWDDLDTHSRVYDSAAVSGYRPA